MGDDRLRQLHRIAESEGTVEAKANLLRERRRSGDLSADWLEVAARLGDPAAIEVFGKRPSLTSGERLRLSFAKGELDDPEVMVRVLIVAADLEPWTRRFPGRGEPAAALEAARRWLDQRDAASRDACAAAAEAAERTIQQAETARPVLGPVVGDDAAERAEFVARHRQAVRDYEAGEEVLNLAMRACGAARIAAGADARDVRWIFERASLDDEDAIRAALVPWALAQSGTPPRVLLLRMDRKRRAAADRQQARTEATFAPFHALLEEKATKKRATALRKRLRAKTLDKNKVTLAAHLGDPAAWLVAKPEGEPDLPVPREGMSPRLSHHVNLFAKKLPAAEIRRIRFLRKLRDPEARYDPQPVWPEWSRELIARLCVGVAQATLERYDGDDSAPREAVAAAVDYLRTREESPELEALAKRSSNVARRKLSPQAKAAAKIAGWLGPLLVRIRNKARKPKLDYANRDLIGTALDAGFGAEELWSLLRETTIAWALEEDDLGVEARAYSAKETFNKGEPIVHPKFGEGRVVQATAKKIQVAFADGERSLVHGL